MSLLKVIDLGIRFGGLHAVKNLSFEIEEGELIGLIGPNGAGKTTCFNMLTGVYTPTSGEIIFAGQKLNGVKPHLVSALGAARTFQNIRLFKELSVSDNLMVAMSRERGYGMLASFFRTPHMRRREEAMKEEALGILKTLSLAPFADLKAGSLPYGIQRKVEIARALATRPKLLLLDEPAAGLNPTETADLANLICEIQKKFKVTVLLIEHDMSLVMKICQRIYVLDYGTLIAQGAPKEIISNPKVIEAYLGGAIGEETSEAPS